MNRNRRLGLFLICLIFKKLPFYVNCYEYDKKMSHFFTLCYCEHFNLIEVLFWWHYKMYCVSCFAIVPWFHSRILHLKTDSVWGMTYHFGKSFLSPTWWEKRERVYLLSGGFWSKRNLSKSDFTFILDLIGLIKISDYDPKTLKVETASHGLNL